MRPRIKAVTAPVVLVLSLASFTACASDEPDYQDSTVEVAAVSGTSVEAGAVQVVLPAGAATGGKLSVQEGPVPGAVPVGVKALGPSAVVSLDDGTLDGSMTVSFAPPPELTPDLVPVVMAEDEQGDWQWLPTSWDLDSERVTAEMTNPGQVYLARFDPEPLVEGVAEELSDKANNLAKVDPPSCGDEAGPLEAGLQVTSEQGDQVLWCVGVDTIESNPAVSGYDVLGDEGVQARVLRLRNNSRMFTEVGYPDDWPAVDGSGRALPGDELRARFGLAGRTRDGLDSRILAPGDTLTLHLPGNAPEIAGTVTADQSAAAWTLSALDFASSTYTRMVSEVDGELGDHVRVVREELVAVLTASPGADAPEPGTDDGSEESGAQLDLDGLKMCLAPVAETILMNPDVAKQLTEKAATCTPSLLRPALAPEVNAGEGAAQMAEGVASQMLQALPGGLESVTAPWEDVPDALTDEHAGFQVWFGPAPVQEYDYTEGPMVFLPGDRVDVDEWDPAFNAYVEGRLETLAEDNEAKSDGSGGIVVGTSCPEGQISVHRYRTDGFALGEVVTCTGDKHRVVLGEQPDGWQELDSIQHDEYFGCEVMGNYSVPAFIAGDTCLDGEQTQEYTG